MKLTTPLRVECECSKPSWNTNVVYSPRGWWNSKTIFLNISVLIVKNFFPTTKYSSKLQTIVNVSLLMGGRVGLEIATPCRVRGTTASEQRTLDGAKGVNMNKNVKLHEYFIVAKIISFR